MHATETQTATTTPTGGRRGGPLGRLSDWIRDFLTIKVPNGADQVPGLSEALAK